VFKNKSLIPMLNAMAEKINQEIIGKLGFGYDDVMFVFKNVDLADKDTMDKIHDRAVKTGRLTINEAREEAGKPPYQGFGNEPVIATSQGLVFLEQFAMKFDEFKKEQEWLQIEADKQKIPVAELRRQMGQALVDQNNADKQPTGTPSPSKPKSDEKPPIKENQKSILVAGLESLTSTIKDAIEKDKNEKTQ
jgi:hypothetical protein